VRVRLPLENISFPVYPESETRSSPSGRLTIAEGTVKHEQHGAMSWSRQEGIAGIAVHAVCELDRRSGMT
jgi:hypothetical protein